MMSPSAMNPCSKLVSLNWDQSQSLSTPAFQVSTTTSRVFTTLLLAVPLNSTTLSLPPVTEPFQHLSVLFLQHVPKKIFNAKFWLKTQNSLTHVSTNLPVTETKPGKSLKTFQVLIAMLQALGLAWNFTWSRTVGGFDWGMNGYIMMARNMNNNCGIASQPSYVVANP